VALFATNLERRLNGTFAKPSSKVVLKQDRERNLLGEHFTEVENRWEAWASLKSFQQASAVRDSLMLGWVGSSFRWTNAHPALPLTG
jgi:hypothetical protein